MHVRVCPLDKSWLTNDRLDRACPLNKDGIINDLFHTIIQYFMFRPTDPAIISSLAHK